MGPPLEALLPGKVAGRPSRNGRGRFLGSLGYRLLADRCRREGQVQEQDGEQSRARASLPVGAYVDQVGRQHEAEEPCRAEQEERHDILRFFSLRHGSSRGGRKAGQNWFVAHSEQHFSQNVNTITKKSHLIRRDF